MVDATNTSVALRSTPGDIIRDMILLRRSLLLGALIALGFIPNNLRSAGTFSGSTTCPASGVKQVLGSPAPAFDYTLVAPTTNLGTINVGSLSVTTSTGIPLQPSFSDHEGASTPIYNLSNVGMICSNSADKLTWVYHQ